MMNHPGRAIAVGILCSIAATVSLWSGALASASGLLHSGAQTPTQAHLRATPSPSVP